MIRESKYILMRVIVGVLIALTLAFIQSCDVKAYVKITTTSPSGNFNPVSDSRIQSPHNAWGTGTKPSYLTGYSPWLIDVGQYQSVSNQTGVYMTVNADFYIGVAFNSSSSAVLNNYHLMDRNPIKASNLRCGMGSGYGTGYDSTYAPSVSNFSIIYEQGNNPTNTFYHHTYHITFTYYQEILRKNNYSGNVSCWFEREPSNGLLAQIVGDQGDVEFYYYNKNFTFNLSLDPNTALLEDIVNKQQQTTDAIRNFENRFTNIMNIFQNVMSSKQDETNQQLQDLNDNINDDNVDAQDSQIRDLVGNDSFKDKTGLSSIITAPISILNKMTQPCTPINLTIPYMDADLSIPCMSTEVYPKFPSGFITTISAVVNGFLVYRIIAALYAMIKNFKDPEDDKIEVVDL